MLWIQDSFYAMDTILTPFGSDNRRLWYPEGSGKRKILKGTRDGWGLDFSPPSYYLQVVICKEKGTGEILAMKLIKKDVVAADNEIISTLTEKRVLCTLQINTHPFLPVSQPSFFTTPSFCLSISADSQVLIPNTWPIVYCDRVCKRRRSTLPSWLEGSFYWGTCQVLWSRDNSRNPTPPPAGSHPSNYHSIFLFLDCTSNDTVYNFHSWITWCWMRKDTSRS